MILNENTADWLKLSPMLAPNTDDAGRHLLTVNSLYFTYFGLCLLGIGSMIFHFRCPIDIKRYQSATHIAERSDDSPVVTARLLPPRFCFDASDEQLVVNKAVEEVVPFLG
ncbi:hypothetical protein HLI17_28275 [Rhizobium laguerreae]|uniref:Uncharacterized protein n=1 Tax=Rhizobium laguerreae TaxID=1076926 RepID=A0A7Y2W8V4_9HYPH|nr:hypothetical protein [Rhizobium laguerreae]